MKNWKHFTRLGLGLVMAVGFTSYLASCKKDDTSSGGNNNTTPPTVKPYISVNGQKFVCAKPKSLKVTLSGAGDSLLTWSGTGFSDTILGIRHTINDIKVGSYIFDSTGIGDPGYLVCSIRWGTLSLSPILNIAKGDYEIKKENGKYVSYLKNGEAFNGSDHKDRYYNIEFKVIWPY